MGRERILSSNELVYITCNNVYSVIYLHSGLSIPVYCHYEEGWELVCYHPIIEIITYYQKQQCIQNMKHYFFSWTIIIIWI